MYAKTFFRQQVLKRIAKNSVTYRYTRFLNDRLQACENLCDSTKTSDVWNNSLRITSRPDHLH